MVDMKSIHDSGWQFTTIPALCARAAETYGGETAIEDGTTRLTFVELDRERRRAAKAMIACGVRKGDRVMIWAPNSWRWCVAALGLVSVGGVLIPTSTRFKGQEVEELMRRSGATMLVSCGDFLGQYYPDQLGEAARALLHTIVVLDEPRRGELSWEAFLARGEGVADAEQAAREAEVGRDDLCDMLFTSGTTGYPKGVMYGHRQCLMAIDAWATRVGIRRGDRVLVIPPFFHAFGYRSGAIVSMMRGAVLLPHLTYDAEEILKRVERDRISVIPGPPAIFHGMLQHPRLAEFDRSTLRLGITGGAVVPATLIRRMRADLGFAGVIMQMAGVRMPLESYPLQALVSEPVKPVFPCVVMSNTVHAYISQSDKGELVIGAGTDQYTSYSQMGGLHIINHTLDAICEMFPMFTRMKMLRSWGGIVDVTPDRSPILAKTPVKGLYVNCGWGTGGFKATPGSGNVFAHTIARDEPHPINAPFTLERFRTGRLIDEAAAAAVAH